MRAKFLVGLVTGLCLLTTWLFSRLYQEVLNAYEGSGTLPVTDYSWVFRLLLNLAGYATVLLPGFIIYKYLEKSHYFDKITNTSWLSRTLFVCFGTPGERLPDSVKPPPASAADSPARESAELALCFGGLMGAYLVWGLLQEKIMTQNYVMSDGSLVKFNDSQFLVFINRLSAFLMALSRLACARASLGSAPLYKFSYCAVTNIMSAWCQYEALKYVSFPTQVLSKSCKVIPVMLMGKLVSGNKYEPFEYVTAALISLGMALFMLGSRGDLSAEHVSTVMTISGILLLGLYMVCDSFTSSWQGELFTQYKVSPLQMMCAVNMFSCALTGAALAQQASTAASIALLEHPVFLTDCLLLSASSALGQLLIYRTIARFGAVVFTIIMTLRQATSILLSCLVYGHSISAGGAFGITLVFAAVFLRVYCRQRLHAVRRVLTAVRSG